MSERLGMAILPVKAQGRFKKHGGNVGRKLERKCRTTWRMPREPDDGVESNWGEVWENVRWEMRRMLDRNSAQLSGHFGELGVVLMGEKSAQGIPLISLEHAL